jgi:hypothetical protein
VRELTITAGTALAVIARPQRVELLSKLVGHAVPVFGLRAPSREVNASTRNLGINEGTQGRIAGRALHPTPLIDACHRFTSRGRTAAFRRDVGFGTRCRCRVFRSARARSSANTSTLNRPCRNDCFVSHRRYQVAVLATGTPRNLPNGSKVATKQTLSLPRHAPGLAPSVVPPVPTPAQ